MKQVLVLLSPLILGCVATAFVPSYYPKLALVTRGQQAPVALTSAHDPLLIKRWSRRGLSPLFYSIAEEIRKLNKGDEGDAMSREDLRLVRDVLRKICSNETKGEDLIQLALQELEEEAIRRPAQQQQVTAQSSGTTTSTIAPAETSSITALTRPEDSVNQTHVEQQGKEIFRKLLGVVELVDDAWDKDDEVMKYATYPVHKEFPDVSLADLMKMVDGVPPLEYFFSNKKFFRVIMRLLLVNVGLGMTEKQVVKAITAEEKYSAVYTKSMLANVVPNPFDLVPLPEHTFNNWMEDKEFARQFLNGVNPVMIRVVKDVHRDLSKELIEFFKDDNGVNLESLAKEKRLLFVSYDDLTHLKVDPHQAYPEAYNPDKKQDQPRYFTAPIAVFRLTQDLQELEILAIQLDRKPGAMVYSPATDTNTWLFAKATVKTADAQMHQWVCHLGKTHLTMEPHIIAIHNTLKKKNHHLLTFFQPMIRDTLFLGFAARNSLAKFGPDSFGDAVTSVGVGQFMQLIKMYWQRYHFFDSSALENELASRGFDKDFQIPCYYYREDGMKLWNAYGSFAMDFLDEIYKTDSDVAADAVLQEWAKETTDKDKAAIPGFPTSFKDKKTLAEVMRTLFWVASGLHAAVNFPQYDYYAYLPNHPLGIRQSMEHFKQTKQQDLNWMFSEAFPLLDMVKETITVARGLTLPSNFCIDNLSDNFSIIGADAYKKFKKELQTIGNDINKRNDAIKKKGTPAYTYLHPSKVPASIDI